METTAGRFLGKLGTASGRFLRVRRLGGDAALPRYSFRPLHPVSAKKPFGETLNPKPYLGFRVYGFRV